MMKEEPQWNRKRGNKRGWRLRDRRSKLEKLCVKGEGSRRKCWDRNTGRQCSLGAGDVWGGTQKGGFK